jgi:hypothetical protein
VTASNRVDPPVPEAIALLRNYVSTFWDWPSLRQGAPGSWYKDAETLLEKVGSAQK